MMWKWIHKQFTEEFSTLGNIGQWVGLLALLTGIIIEIQYEAHVGFITITCGSLIFTLATKAKHERKVK